MCGLCCSVFLDLYDLPMKSHLHVADSTSLVEALLSCQGLAMMRYGLVYEPVEKGAVNLPVAYLHEVSV